MKRLSISQGFATLAFALALATTAVAQEAGTPAAASGEPAAEPAGADASPPDTVEATAEGAAEGGEAAAEGGEAAAEPAAPAADASELQTADENYNVKVRELEGRINDLKEQIFRSKAKLTLLTEQVTGGVGTGASAVIVHENQMGANFQLIEAHYFLDGAPIWQDTDEEGVRLTEQTERQLFDGNLVEGSHTLNVRLVYRGNGSGVFSYLSGYTFRLKNSITFKAEPGKVVTIRSVGYEKGNFTTEMTERPDIKFEQNITEAQAKKK
jgi:hypothetical protein